jgi:hypothetical protein
MADGHDGTFAYVLDVARAFVLVEYPETDAPDRLAASIRRVLADPRYEATFSWIADRRQERHAPSPDVVRERVAVIDSLLASCSARRWVRVVDRRHPSIFGCARMADAFMENIGWESFSCGTLEEAFAWCTGSALTGRRAPDPPAGIAPTEEPVGLTVLELPRRTTPRSTDPSGLVVPHLPVPVPDRRRARQP